MKALIKKYPPQYWPLGQLATEMDTWLKTYFNRFGDIKAEVLMRGYREVYVGKQSEKILRIEHNKQATHHQMFLIDETTGEIIDTNTDTSPVNQESMGIMRVGQMLSTAWFGKTAWITATFDGPGSEQERRLEEKLQRNRLKGRLKGMEAAYLKYRQYKKLNKYKINTDRRSLDSHNPGLTENKAYALVEGQLESLLKSGGYSSIQTFEKDIQAFERAFVKESYQVALDALDAYQMLLHKEEKRYKNPSEAADLEQKVAKTKAKSLYTQARKGESAFNISSFGVDKYTSASTRSMRASVSSDASEKRSEAENQMKALGKKHPLLKNQDFNREGLTTASSTQDFMLKYIADRYESVQTIRKKILEDQQRKDPKLIYKLDLLLEQVYKNEGISKGSIYHQIISDRKATIEFDEMFGKVALAIIAIGLGVISFGGGTIGAVAGAGALGLSTYDAFVEFQEYETKHAAYGAKMYSKDATMAWAIVALIGAGLDAAGLKTAIKSISPAVDAFNKTGNVARLEKSLKRLKSIDDKVQRNIVRAAKLRAKKLALLGRFNSFGVVLEQMVLIIKQGNINAQNVILEIQNFITLKNINSLDVKNIKEIYPLAKEIAENPNSKFAKAIKGNPGLIEAWKKLSDLGVDQTLNKNLDILKKVDNLTSKGLSNTQIKNIGNLNDPKAFDIANNLSNNPKTHLNNIDGIVANSKALEAYDSQVMDKVTSLTKSNRFSNPDELDEFLTRSLADSKNNNFGWQTELDEATELLNQGKRVSMSHSPQTSIEIDIINHTDNSVTEVKKVTSSNFNKNLGKIGEKFNSEAKLPSLIRDSFDDLHGIIEITDGPLFRASRDKMLRVVKKYIKQLSNSSNTKILTGLNNLKTLKIKNGSSHPITFIPKDWAN
ncbi:hypothetical protein [uncultured Microscilla sp.]|uniref:hypothetical protein n=1 Tax=uncultured Microscilla sp. TaxID=432653 RepID=UPI0026130A76|nr:hypothetical protein [uncultured Microscilla sp.]